MDGPFAGIFNIFEGKEIGPDYLWDEHIPENENTPRIKIKNFYKFGLKRNINHWDFCVFITILSNKNCANYIACTTHGSH